MMELPEEKICARGEVCNLPERVFREITMFAKKHSIQKVILFGSRSRGTQREAIQIQQYMVGILILFIGKSKKMYIHY